jgi:hypothetical protein
MKIRPVGAELFHVDRRADGRTDMTRVVVAFRSFSKAPKNVTKNDQNCIYRFVNFYWLKNSQVLADSGTCSSLKRLTPRVIS